MVIPQTPFVAALFVVFAFIKFAWGGPLVYEVQSSSVAFSQAFARADAEGSRAGRM